MDVESLRNFCLSLNQTSEYFPFDEHTLAFKVIDKIYALTALNEEEFKVNLKCDPEYAEQLRDLYPEAVKPGFHMNKRHWNTVSFEKGLPEKLLEKLVRHSYDCVVAKLPQSQRKKILE